MTILVSEFFKKESDNEATYSTFYLSSKTEIINNESNIDNILESIYNNIRSDNIPKSHGKGLTFYY